MTKLTKRSLLLATFVLMISMVVMLVAVADYSGTDSGITWTVDTSCGELTVSGNGTMPEYAVGTAPWYQYKSCIKTVTVNSGVTLSKGAFYGLENLESIYVPYVGDGSANTYFGYIFGASNYFQNETYVPKSLKYVEVTGSTAIADYAFNNVSGIEKLVLADSIVNVGSNAFKDCASLKSLVLGSGVSSIGTNAILRCNSLVYVFYNGTSTGWSGVTLNSNSISPVFLASGTLSLTAPEKTVYALGENLDTAGLAVTFGGNDVTDAVEVKAPDMTTMGVKTVYVYFGTKAATFSITVESTGASGVSGVLTWSIVDGVLTVSGSGMMDNYTLETLAPWHAYRDVIGSVNVASGVTSVGDYAFYGLDEATKITVADTVETIGYAAFENCSALADLAVANSAAVMDGTALRNCTALMTTVSGSVYATVSGNAYYALISADKTATAFTVPSATVVIAEGAFESSALTSISIPAGVKVIGDNAFASSADLTSATIGAGVKHIGNYAFVDCAKLATVTFNAVPDFVGAGAFAATAVNGTVSNGAEYLGTADNAYAILWKAASADAASCTLNANTKVIAALAFANCTALEAVQLPEGLLHIGDSAFNGCTALYSVKLPSTVLTVGDQAFKGCSALTSAELSASLKTIGNSAFRGASKLSEMIVYSDVENVGYNAFRDCTALEYLVFNAKSGIGYKAFANCTSLKTVYLADTVLSIGDYAFMGCSGLTDLAIPDTTAYIGYGALMGCGAIDTLSIPFAGEKANAEVNGTLAHTFGGNVPAAFDILLVGGDLNADALDGITAINLLIIDKTTNTINASSIDVAPKAVYYLGSEAEWNDLRNDEDLANVAFANGEYDLVSVKETYEVGEILDLANFTATLGTYDVTSILRFVNNPIISEEVMLRAKIGTVAEKFVAKYVEEVSITNYSLLLEGSIGVKFYVKLSEFAVESFDEVSATIDYFGKIYDVELEKAENTVDGTMYTTKFYIAAKEMNQPITLTVSTPNSTKSVTRAVCDYVKYVNENSEEYADCLTLINEMYNYGEYSRSFFENATITPNPDLSDVTITLPAGYTPVKKGSVDGIVFEGTSLLLESKTSVRHYFSIAEGHSISEYTFNVNGINVEPAEKDGLYYVEVDNIIARDLGKLDKAVISSASGSMAITYSPLSYVKQVLEGYAETNPALANLSKALYNYYVASADYFKGVTDDIVTGDNESAPSIW